MSNRSLLERAAPKYRAAGVPVTLPAVLCALCTLGSIVGMGAAIAYINRLSYGSSAHKAFTPGNDRIPGIDTSLYGMPPAGMRQAEAHTQGQVQGQAATWPRPTAGLLAASPASISLRAMSFNIRYANRGDKGWRGWPARASAVSGMIADIGPGIVGCQEVLPLQYRDLKDMLGPAYGSVYVEREPGRAGGSEGVPVFWLAGQFTLLASHTRWLSSTPGKAGSKGWGAAEPRIVTIVRLRHRVTGRPVTILNSHWDHKSSSARVRSAELVGQWAGEERDRGRGEGGVVLVMGDFNSYGGTSDPSIQSLSRTSPWLLDVLHGADMPTYHGWAGVPKRGSRRIDWIWVGQGAQVLRAWVQASKYHGILPSDHFPVCTDLLL